MSALRSFGETTVLKDLKKLRIRQHGTDLADRVYAVIEDIPWQKGQNVIDQLSGSSLSIPSNIAEGNSRRGEKDTSRFMEIVLGSAFESETQRLFVERRRRTTAVRLEAALDMVRSAQRMLQGFMVAPKP